MNQNAMTMPKMKPVPIRTKNVPYLVALWRWMTTVRKWEIVEDWEFRLPDGARVLIPADFVFDGASIPRRFWSILSPTGLLFIPSLIHDFAYRYDCLLGTESKDGRVIHRRHAGRAYWDRLFRDIAIQVNGFRAINYLAWVTLVAFGWFAWRKNRLRKEQCGTGAGYFITKDMAQN